MIILPFIKVNFELRILKNFEIELLK